MIFLLFSYRSINLKMYTLELTSACTIKWGKDAKFPSEFSEREAGKGDLTIQVNDGSTQVHRAVLMKTSEYFKTMFMGTFSESSATSLNLSSVFNHIDEANALFDFIYTGVIVLSGTSIECIVNAASLFLLRNDLLDACSRFLTTNLAPSTCLPILLLAERYRLHSLHEACIEVLETWFPSILCTKPEALEIAPDAMRVLFDEDLFTLPDDQINETFLRKWYQHLVENTEGSVSLPPELKNYLKPYITEIVQDPQHSGDEAGHLQDPMGETEAIKDPQDCRDKTEVTDSEGATVSQDLVDEAKVKDRQNSKEKTDAKDPHISETESEDSEEESGLSDKHYLGNDPKVSGVEEVLYTTLKGPVPGSTRCCIEIHVLSPSLERWKFVLRHAFSEVVKVGAVPRLIDVKENRAYFILVQDDLVDFDECVIVVDLESKKEDIVRTPKHVCTKRDRHYGNKPHYFFWSNDLCGIFLDRNNVDWFIFRNEHKDACTGSCDGQCWNKMLEFSYCKNYGEDSNQSEFLTKMVGDNLYLWVKETLIEGHSGNVWKDHRWYLTCIVKPGKEKEHTLIDSLGSTKEPGVIATASNPGNDSGNNDSEMSSSSDHEDYNLPETRETRILARKRHRKVYWNYESEWKMIELPYPPNSFSEIFQWSYSALTNIYAFQSSKSAESLTFIHRLDPVIKTYDMTEKAWRNETAFQIVTYLINEDIWVEDTIQELPDPKPRKSSIVPVEEALHKTSLPMALPCKRLVNIEGLDKYDPPLEDYELGSDGWYVEPEDPNTSHFIRGPETCVGAIYHCITTSAYKTSVFRLKAEDTEWQYITELPYSLNRFPFFQIGEMSVAHFETLPNSIFEDFSDQVGQSGVASRCVHVFNKYSVYSNELDLLNDKQYEEKLGKVWQEAFDKKFS